MGLSYKQVSCEDGLDWGQNLFPSEAFNLPNPPQATQQQSTPLNCPRCNSTNTKFCYYNNYNRSQPRHFCKSCKRHWTKGGTLRNVPVGGGRKNKKHKTSKTSAINSHGSNLKNVNEIPSQTLFNSSSTSSSSSGLQVNYVNNEVDKFEIDNKSTVFEPKISTYPLASLSSFDRNFSFLSSSFQSSNGFNFTGENEAFETPICNTITMTSPLQIPTTSSFMDSCSNWNWDELTTFISTDLRQEWDESQL